MSVWLLKQHVDHPLFLQDSRLLIVLTVREQLSNNSAQDNYTFFLGSIMNHILRLFLIGFFSTVLFIAGCSGGSDSGVNKDPAPDLDGDGIADIVDPDIDGDGIPNGKDPDDDNDGIEDTVDPTPPAKPSNQTCTHAEILPPSDEASFGDKNASLGWNLLPEGCVVPLARSPGSGLPVTAKNTNREEAPSEARATYERCDTWKGGVGVRCEVPIKIPDGCGDEEIYYEIDEIKDFLQDSKGLGKYSQKVSHKGEECPGGGPEPEPECPDGATGEHGDCDCGSDKGYNQDTNLCVSPNINPNNLTGQIGIGGPDYNVLDNGDVEITRLVDGWARLYTPAGSVTQTDISALEEPRWSASPEGYLEIYTSGARCKTKAVKIDRVTLGSSGPYFTIDPGNKREDYNTWSDLQDAPELENCSVAKATTFFAFGNYIVSWRDVPPITIRSYDPQ